MKQITSADEIHEDSSFKLEDNLSIFSVKIYILELSKHCAISIYGKMKKINRAPSPLTNLS